MTNDIVPQNESPETMYSKRYWLFRWYNYEGAGGLNDFTGSFDSVESAIAETADSYMDRGHIFDSKSLKLAAWVTTTGQWAHLPHE